MKRFHGSDPPPSNPELPDTRPRPSSTISCCLSFGAGPRSSSPRVAPHAAASDRGDSALRAVGVTVWQLSNKRLKLTPRVGD
jgi:hypothetical protein